jgi:hypothetical protein
VHIHITLLNLCHEFISKDTWRKAFYFLSRKKDEDLKRPLTGKDIIPIILAVALALSIGTLVAILLSRILKLLGMI